MRLFQFLGADWIQFKRILTLSIRLDLRGGRGVWRQRGKVSPIFGTLIFYGLMGACLAGSLVLKTTPFLYSLLTFSYSMVMIAFTVILEFENTIIHQDDVEVLAHRPVRLRTYFLAKLCNILFYMTLIGTALCILPSFIGIGVQGCRWTFPFAYFPVSLIANLCAASFVVLIYTGLMKVMQYERFRDVLAYFQIGFAFVIFFSYQLIPRMGQEFVEKGTDVSKAWLYATPSAWFAGSVQVLLGLGKSMDVGLTVIAVVTAALLILFSFRRISLRSVLLNIEFQKPSVLEKKVNIYKSKNQRKGFFVRLVKKIFPFPEIRAGYHFTSCLIKRDRSVKIGIYPVFGMPLAVLVLAIVERELVDPFEAGPFLLENSLSVMVIFFIFFMIYFSMMGVTYSRDWEAAWIYHVAPIAYPGRFYQGVKLAVLFRFMLPFFILLGAIYCTQIPLVHAIKHTVSLFLFGLVAFSTVSFVVKDSPFSKKREKGERIQRFSFLFFVMPFFGLTLLIQRMVYKTDSGWGATLVVLCSLIFVLEFFATKRLDRVLKHREFFS